MHFGKLAIEEAQGAILAHSITTRRGVIKKGRVLGAEDVARLREAGHTTIIAARLERDDVGEDDAARRVAAAAAGAGTHATAPFTGRCNLFASGTGLVVLDREAIGALNALDEGLTIATVPPFEKVEPEQMLATVKVITFALPERVVAEAERIGRAAKGLVRVAAFARRTAGLIMTRMPSTKASVLEKRRQAIGGRLAALGATLGAVETVAHEEGAVAAAIDRLAKSGLDPIVVFAASAIVDRGDVIPAALVAAGGEIVRLGMPVDPGNLMLLGRLGPVDVIGAPSCAASPKLNGFDWILERRLAGLEVGMGDVAAMGVGGLLKEIATRPQPREKDAAEGEAMDEGVRKAPRIALIVLAAGRSTRFGGGRNKLMADLDGRPLVRRTLESLLASRARPAIVVTGHDRERVEGALAGLDVHIVHNPDYATGLASSLKAGLKALPRDIDGFVVALGDMPRVTGALADRLVAGFAPKEGRTIVMPVHQGKRGNPVLFAAALATEMRDVEGDVGAKAVIGAHADEVAEVEAGNDAIFLDVDTAEALERVTSGGGKA
jgi:molybdenum cofactor cytidylyltransferase